MAEPQEPWSESVNDAETNHCLLRAGYDVRNLAADIDIMRALYTYDGQRGGSQLLSGDAWCVPLCRCACRVP